MPMIQYKKDWYNVTSVRGLKKTTQAGYITRFIIVWFMWAHVTTLRSTLGFREHQNAFSCDYSPVTTRNILQCQYEPINSFFLPSWVLASILWRDWILVLGIHLTVTDFEKYRLGRLVIRYGQCTLLNMPSHEILNVLVARDWFLFENVKCLSPRPRLNLKTDKSEEARHTYCTVCSVSCNNWMQ